MYEQAQIIGGKGRQDFLIYRHSSEMLADSVNLITGKSELLIKGFYNNLKRTIYI